jgi:hypothetical protein
MKLALLSASSLTECLQQHPERGQARKAALHVLVCHEGHLKASIWHPDPFLEGFALSHFKQLGSDARPRYASKYAPHEAPANNHQVAK